MLSADKETVNNNKFIETASSFLPISALILIQLKLKSLVLSQPEEIKSFEVFTSNIRQTLVKVYGILEHDEEWLEEMIIADVMALENLQARMEAKLSFLDSNQLERDAPIQHLLSHLLIVLLSGASSPACPGSTTTTSMPKDAFYDARLRCLLKNLAQSLFRFSKKSIPFIVSLAESDYLFQMASEVNRIENVDRDISSSTNNGYAKGIAVGLSVVAGGLLVGVTGGLAVPLIAGGLSSMGVAGAGLTAFGSVAGAAIFGSTLGVAGAGLAGFKISRHYNNLEEFTFTPITNVSSAMSYTIAISGWITALDDGIKQWQFLTEINPLIEVNVLEFDRQSLVDLTTAADEFIKTNLIGYGVYGAAVAATGTLAMAISLPVTALQGLAMIDNPWNLSLSKCETAGIVLARNVLVNRLGGNRPVNLIGHGMGARVIVYCMLELLKMRDQVDIWSLVDSVYLFGACVSLNTGEWEQIAGIPASRFVNCYSENDWFLKVLFRLKLTPAAGTAKIGIRPIQDVNVSSLIGSHGDYIEKMEDLLTAVGYEKHI